MIVYKVFYKNYDLKKGEFIGALVERRKSLRGKTKVETGLRWAKLTFGHLIKDKHAIFVVPAELNLGIDIWWLVEKRVFPKLKQILSDPIRPKETDIIERCDHNPESIIRAE